MDIFQLSAFLPIKNDKFRPNVDPAQQPSAGLHWGGRDGGEDRSAAVEPNIHHQK